MAIVGGFIGGGVEMVPAGRMQMCLQWNTEDRENISGAVFTLTGTEGTYTANGDASGRAEIVVPAGTYTVSVTHSGLYNNDGPQTVIGESANSYLVLFDAYIRSSGVTFLGVALGSAASYKIVDSEGSTAASGTGWSETMSFPLGTGTYTLHLTYGTTAEIPFEVKSGLYQIVQTEKYIAVATCTNIPEGSIVSVNGAVVSTGATSFRIPKGGAATFSAVLPTYSNGTHIATALDIVVDTNQKSVEVTFAFSRSIVLITENGDFGVPVSGTYSVFVIGGGGHGNFGGGGGGHVTYNPQQHLDEGTYMITIGDGATYKNGGTTSFGRVLSANGGGAGKEAGGDGGSGGGGGYINSRYYNGGNGDFGGGGGGGGYGGAGGSGGTYGGAGGSSYGSGSNGVHGDGGIFGTGDAPGGKGYTNKGGSGGGGGYGAAGGNAVKIGNYSTDNGGGGGGGGYCGGDGGTGWMSGTGATSSNVQLAKGYGAGGSYIGTAAGTRGFGGGGGGYGSTQIVSGVNGAPGCVVLMWVSV